MTAAVGQGLQIPRGGLALLLAALVLVVLPHLPRLPLGVMALVLVCLAWQVQIYRSRWRFPGGLLKGALVVLGIAAVALEQSTLLGLESAVALLVVAVVLKLIEMRGKRDAYLVVVLAYFVLATCFLFSQGIPITLYVLAAATTVTAALVTLNNGTSGAAPLPALRTALVLMGQALPMAVVLFLFFPRVAPLWSVPLPSSARTGMAGEVTPGDIANLSQSDELAFRASFTGGVPGPNQLYWRGIVFSDYSNGTWSQGRVPRGARYFVHWANSGRLPDWLESLKPTGRPLDYQVVLEATDRPWLFALDLPGAAPEGAGLARDFRLVARLPVTSRKQYQVRSWPTWQLDESLPGWLQERSLQLPENDNPGTLALARRMSAAAPDPQAYVQAVLAMYRNQQFHYTLQPPVLPRANAVDAFLLDSQRGFCAHFAGSFVYLMRAAGLPARMIGGYQGGEVNAADGYVSVRQYDAHAWAEVWLPQRGWVRVDPTAAVAPMRIERGLSAALAANQELAGLSPFSGMRLRGMTLLGDLLQFTDGIEHRWNLWVVSYDAKAQAQYLRGLLGEVTPARMGLALLLGLGGLMLVLTPLVLVRRPRFPKARDVRLVLGLQAVLAKAGVPAIAGESPAAHLRRAASDLPRQHSALQSSLQKAADELEQVLYDPLAPAALAANYRSRVRGLLWRLRLTWWRPKPAAG